MGFSGGYESRLTFNNGAYDYVVFTAMYSLGPTNPDKDIQAVVLVAKDGAQIARKRCTDPVQVDFKLSPTAAKIYSDVDNQKRFVQYYLGTTEDNTSSCKICTGLRTV